MKFTEILDERERNGPARWMGHYINYRALKETLYARPSSSSKFQDTLQREILRINAEVAKEQTWLAQARAELATQRRRAPNTSGRELFDRARVVWMRLDELRDFVKTVYETVYKATKKHDKLTHHTIMATVLSVLEQQPFMAVLGPQGNTYQPASRLPAETTPDDCRDDASTGSTTSDSLPGSVQGGSGTWLLDHPPALKRTIVDAVVNDALQPASRHGDASHSTARVKSHDDGPLPWDAPLKAHPEIEASMLSHVEDAIFSSLEFASAALRMILPELQEGGDDWSNRLSKLLLVSERSKARIYRRVALPKYTVRQLYDAVLAHKLELLRYVIKVVTRAVELSSPDGAAALELVIHAHFALCAPYMRSGLRQPSTRRVDVIRSMRRLTGRDVPEMPRTVGVCQLDEFLDSDYEQGNDSSAGQPTIDDATFAASPTTAALRSPSALPPSNHAVFKTRTRDLSRSLETTGTIAVEPSKAGGHPLQHASAQPGLQHQLAPAVVKESDAVTDKQSQEALHPLCTVMHGCAGVRTSDVPDLTDHSSMCPVPEGRLGGLDQPVPQSLLSPEAQSVPHVFHSIRSGVDSALTPSRTGALSQPRSASRIVTVLGRETSARDLLALRGSRLTANRRQSQSGLLSTNSYQNMMPWWKKVGLVLLGLATWDALSQRIIPSDAEPDEIDSLPKDWSWPVLRRRLWDMYRPALLRWLPEYSIRKHLLSDVAAGITIGIVLIPQGLAYATLAGLPPAYGLYTGLPAIVYACFGSSSQAAIGPMSIPSLLLATGIASMSPVPSGQTYIETVLIITALVGVIMLGLGLLNMAFLVRFASRPVLSGFTMGSVILTIASVAKDILGVKIARSQVIYTYILDIATALPNTRIPTLITSIVALVLLISLPHIPYAKKVPASLPVVALAVAVFGTWHSLTNVPVLGAGDSPPGGVTTNPAGVALVGYVPSSIPVPRIPNLALLSQTQTFATAFGIILVGFVESIAVAKLYAEKHGYEISAGSELKAIGLTNLIGSMIGSLPVMAGFSRSSICDDAGARTPLNGAISALTVILLLLFITPALYYLPNCVLAALIVSSVIKLMDFAGTRRLWKQDKRDFITLLASLFATLFLGVLLGVLVSMAVSLVIFLATTTQPKVEELGHKQGTAVYTRLGPVGVSRVPDVIILKFHAPLLFFNCSVLKDRTVTEYHKRNELPPRLQWRALILCFTSVNNIDTTAIQTFCEILTLYHAAGLPVLITDLSTEVERALQRSGVVTKMGGSSFITLRVHDAVHAVINGTVSQRLLPPLASGVSIEPTSFTSATRRRAGARPTHLHLHTSTVTPFSPDVPSAGTPVSWSSRGREPTDNLLGSQVVLTPTSLLPFTAGGDEHVLVPQVPVSVRRALRRKAPSEIRGSAATEQ